MRFGALRGAIAPRKCTRRRPSDEPGLAEPGPSALRPCTPASASGERDQRPSARGRPVPEPQQEQGRAQLHERRRPFADLAMRAVDPVRGADHSVGSRQVPLVGVAGAVISVQASPARKCSAYGVSANLSRSRREKNISELSGR